MAGEKNNPPDKFEFFKKTNDPVADLAAINQLGNQGYTEAGPALDYPDGTYVLFGGYKG